MRTHIAILASVVLLTGSAAAQTPTAAGVDAYLRGDYNTAAEILKPIADRTFDRDYAAEFFMASLYESGRGVPVDLVRACALYLRSAYQGSPFETQGPSLWRAARKRLTSEEADDCTSSANIGLNHGFQPKTFTLESDHWVAWNVRGATVTYQGREKTRQRRRGAEGLEVLSRPIYGACRRADAIDAAVFHGALRLGSRQAAPVATDVEPVRGRS